MTIIAWLVVGAVAGWVAQTILRTRTGMVTMIGFGIVGAVVGGAIGSFLNRGDLVTGINFTSIVVAIIGALVAGGVGVWWSRRGAT